MITKYWWLYCIIVISMNTDEQIFLTIYVNLLGKQLSGSVRYDGNEHSMIDANLK